MSKNTKLVLVLLLLVAVIIIFPLLTIRNSEFGGADGDAEEAIGEIDPDYQPWQDNLIAPPGGETESLLFCLQAALGSGVLAYGFGYLVARKKYQKTGNEQ